MRSHLTARLSLKTVTPTGQFSGRASVYNVIDAVGDVVLPGAFAASLRENGGRIVVLSQHDPTNAIGMATLTDAGDALHCDGRLEMELASAREEHVRLKAGLLTGISIGYETIRESFKNGVRQLHEVKLWEISLVTFPANTAARVTDVKHATPLVEFAASLRSTVQALKGHSR